LIKSELAKDSPAAIPLDSVPMLDLKRQYQQIGAEVLAAVERVCASQHYIFGPEVEAFEGEIAAFCGARNAVGETETSSGFPASTSFAFAMGSPRFQTFTMRG